MPSIRPAQELLEQVSGLVNYEMNFAVPPLLDRAPPVLVAALPPVYGAPPLAWPPLALLPPRPPEAVPDSPAIPALSPPRPPLPIGASPPAPEFPQPTESASENAGTTRTRATLLVSMV